MFLFDKTRHGRQRHASGNRPGPVRWRTFLNTHPNFGAESTAAFDEAGNLYFGSHNGNFYSLDTKGRIRWTFTTEKKIYGSPLVQNTAVYFSGGDGYFYCLSLEGKIRWVFDLSNCYRVCRKAAFLFWLSHLPFTFDVVLRRIILINSWSSPNCSDGKLLITGYGKGLHCLDSEGNLLWDFDLGFPRNQLSGVAIDDKNRIYCPSRKGVSYAVSDKGSLIWEKMTMRYGEPWGNPVVCSEADRVLFFYSNAEKKGMVVAYSLDGILRWTFSCSAVRGSAAVSHDGETVYFCDFDGYIRRVAISDGRELASAIVGFAGVSRSLWTTPTLDQDGNILLSTKDGLNKGRILKLDFNLREIWSWRTDKVLSVPVIGSEGEIYFGGWDGYYYCLETKSK